MLQNPQVLSLIWAMGPSHLTFASAGSERRLYIVFTLRKKLDDFFDRIPIARGSGHAQLFLNLAEVADRFHLATIHTEDESVFNGDDLQQPVVVRG